jgi:peptidoglycan/xylan/chitin deacetylase (PgdA/CDA1 family)
LRSSTFLQRLFPHRVWSISTDKKEIFLTFDDGPIPDVTPWVLNTLKTHKAKATFFCIGDNIKKHPELFQQIIDEGHSIGNHTFSHLNGWKTSSKNYLENIEACKQEIELHSAPTHLFRPPYGKCTSTQAKALKKDAQQIIMWDILSKDYKSSLSKEACFHCIERLARAGSIIVFHDSLKAEKNMKYALVKTLKTFKKFTFSALKQ